MRKVKTLSSGIINQSFEDRSGLSSNVQKSLTVKLDRSFGRDAKGQISVRHRGGGAKRRYRMISNLENFFDKQVKVLDLQYDPNRTANIALVELSDGSKKYIIAPDKLNIGDILTIGNAENPGDRAMLKDIQIGSFVHNIEMYPGSKKAVLVKSAGTKAILMTVEGEYALLKLPSGELRKVHANCFASVGQVSNPDHSNLRIGKAGRSRRMGKRPTVRGKAMNPNSHPHGGGEGVNPIGLKYPKTPWGKVAIGKKTRKSNNSDKFIVKRRAKKKR